MKLRVVTLCSFIVFSFDGTRAGCGGLRRRSDDPWLASARPGRGRTDVFSEGRSTDGEVLRRLQALFLVNGKKRFEARSVVIVFFLDAGFA